MSRILFVVIFVGLVFRRPSSWRRIVGVTLIATLTVTSPFFSKIPPRAREKIVARPGWANIDAVKNGKIFGVDPNIISRPGPRIVDALEQVAKDLYPEKFS